VSVRGAVQFEAPVIVLDARLEIEWSTFEHNSHPVLFPPDHSTTTLRRFHLNH